MDVPSGVAGDRVVDFDIFNPPGIDSDYFAAWKSLMQPDGPGIVWTTANGGHWIATRGDVVRSLWADSERLSSEVLAVTPGLGEMMKFIPLQQDPPEHGPFRLSVMKGLASRYVVALEPKVAEVTRELIATIKPAGACEFVEEFAEILPLHIFLTLIDVPLSDRPRLRALGAQLTRPDGSMTVEQLRDAADDYLRPFIEARMANPGEDLFSRIFVAGVDGRPWTMEEARRMCRNLLFGGLDTVVAMIGMITLHLARNPQDQAYLRAHSELLPQAADELMRRYPTVSVSRNAVVDMEIDGVQVRKGDIVYLPSVLHNLDPAAFEAPEEVRYDRALNPTRHTTLGAGAHRCVGAGLARMEVIVFLREWLANMPDIRLDPDKPVLMKGGNVGACTALPLIWD